MQRYRGRFVLTVLCVVSAFGRQKPNFTGTWKQVGDSNWVEIDKIEHQDSHLKVTEARDTIATALPRVPLVRMHGEHEYRTDGDEHAENGNNGRQWWTTAYWQGSALVFQSVVKDGYRVTVTRESWTLSDTGETLTKTRRIVNMDGVTQKTLTFRRQ